MDVIERQKHSSKRRMLATSRSVPGSPPGTSQEDVDNAFDMQIGRTLAESGFKSNSATPRLAREETPRTHARAFHPDASLVLVGISGSGKSSLGFIAATALGRRFIQEDHFFQTVTGISRQDYLKIHGSQEFHKADVEASRRMLEEHKRNAVVECGLGSLTSSVQDHLRSYCLTNPVVHLVRNMGDIKLLLKLSERSARMLESGDLTHRRCSNFEYFNLEDVSMEGLTESGNVDRQSPAYSFKLKEVKEDFSFFARFVTGATRSRPDEDSPFSLAEIPVERRLYSHALEVKLSWYLENKVDFSQLESAGDVVEVVIDQWSTKAKTGLSRIVADIRRRLAIPVVVSARRGFNGLTSGDYLTAMKLSLRLAIDYLAIDLELDTVEFMAIVAMKGHTRIIGHFMDLSQNPDGWESDSWLTKYNRAEKLGCDVVRLLKAATSREDNEMLSRFTHKVRGRAGLSPPVIAYNVGPLGRTSQIFNQILSTVTHPALQISFSAEAEKDANTREAISRPQISSQDAVQALFRSFVLDPMHFFILGGSVSYSLSPAMHNSAYKLLGMDHKYGTKDISSLDELDIMAKDPRLGGVAVVQPYKVLALKHVSSKSRHADIIGAANTLLPLRAWGSGNQASPLRDQANQRNRAGPIVGWHGENTDWVGISVILTRSLSPRNVIQPKSTGLVVGSGGMARAATYAMLKLGVQNVFVYNRTASHAEVLAAHFNTWLDSKKADNLPARVRILPSFRDTWPSSYAMPTIIVSCVNEESTKTKTAANFEVPQQWLKSPSGGVIIEMAYNNRATALIRQIRQLQKESDIPWVLVTGIEVLPEQAIAQFELMTGRKAPRSVMRKAAGVGQAKPT